MTRRRKAEFFFAEPDQDVFFGIWNLYGKIRCPLWMKENRIMKEAQNDGIYTSDKRKP